MALMGGTYDAWKVAGSLRRGRLDVGDAEHVIIGTTVQDPTPAPIRDLFGQPIAEHMAPPPRNLALQRLDQLLHNKDIALAIKSDGSTRWGDKYRALTLPGRTMHHELWFCDPLNYGAMLAIRTGPQEIGISLVTRFRDRGMRQVDGYLRRVDRTPNPDGTASEHIGEIIPVPDEDTYFRLAGWKAAPPPESRDTHASLMRSKRT